MKGFLSLCVYMPLDKLMHKLMGERWLEKKEKLAEKRANLAIERIRKAQPDGSFTQLSRESLA
jgi:hypothetical protein